MKILFLTHYSKKYGANVALIKLITLLKKYNIEPYIIIPEHGEIENELNKNSIRYEIQKFYMCKSTVGTPGYKKVFKFVFNLLSYLIYFPKMRKKEFDLVYSNSTCVDYGYYLSTILKIPHIWHIREFGIEDYNLVNILPSCLVNKMYKNASMMIAISKEIKDYYTSKYNDLNIQLIYDGVDKKDFEKKFSNGTNIDFCLVGLISKRKNQLEAIKAARLLIDSNIRNFTIHILGDGNSEYVNYVKSQVVSLGLSDYVIFYGYVYDVPSKIRNFDVGLMTSLKEGFGLVTVEYFMSYMPVIGKNSGATPELIINNENGMLYDKNEVELANCMKQYIVDPELIKKHGMNAHKIALKNFSVEKNAKKIYEVIRSLNGKNK